MGHVEMRAHRRSLGVPSVPRRAAPAPCHLLPSYPLDYAGAGWPREAAGPCALVGCRGGYRTGPVMPPLWGRLLVEMCCWQHEVSEAGLGSSQGPAVSRYP